MKKAIIRMTTLVLSLALVLSFSLSVSATEGQMTLEEVFLEAQANYSVSPARYSADDPGVSPVYYEEQEMPDGSTLIVTGYPTDYTNDETPLEPGQELNSYIYSLTRSGLDEYGVRRSTVWGYFSSTIKYETDIIYDMEMVRIDSFSYEVELDSGYSMSLMEVTYFSYWANEVSEDYTFTTTSLTMTNYPTTRLGWVYNNSMTEVLSNTGVKYDLTINGTHYAFIHNLVPYGFLED